MPNNNGTELGYHLLTEHAALVAVHTCPFCVTTEAEGEQEPQTKNCDLQSHARRQSSSQTQ